MTHSASQSSARRRACLNLLALLLVFAVTTLACNVRRASAATRAPITVADFEAESYGDWRVTGDAFGDKPASATVPGGMGPVFNHKGAQLVNTYASPTRDGNAGVSRVYDRTLLHRLLHWRRRVPRRDGRRFICRGREGCERDGLVFGLSSRSRGA